MHAHVCPLDRSWWQFLCLSLNLHLQVLLLGLEPCEILAYWLLVRQWHRLPREVVESLSPEVFRKQGDVSEGCGLVGIVEMVWWLELVILVVFSNLNVCMNSFHQRSSF